MNSHCKVIKINLLNEFLMQCLNKFVCPKWLVSRIYKSKIKHSQKAEVIFIKSEISKNNHYLSNLRLVIDMCSIKLKNELREDHSRKFDMYIRKFETKQMERIKEKNEKNLKRLVSCRY